MTQGTRCINGYRISQAIDVAASLRIVDHLRGRPKTSDDLAEATRANARALYQLLRALAAVGVFREDDGRSSRSHRAGRRLAGLLQCIGRHLLPVLEKLKPVHAKASSMIGRRYASQPLEKLLERGLVLLTHLRDNQEEGGAGINTE
jgi:hypothetical protein